MLSLSYPGLAFYAVVLIGAFAVRSAAGFGAVLVAVPMLAFILPMTTAVPVATALAVVTSIRYVGRDWRHIAWRQFVIISLYTIVGVAVGFYFLRVLNEHTLRRGLAVFLIIYSIYALSTGGLPPNLSARWHGALAAFVGIFGGFFGALFGGGVGPLYVVYFNILRVDRDTFRATMTTVMLV
ncbi:MAG: sulfite exporter TauE/SafE family protein, partial [Stellaceae bacterium]